MSFRAKRETPVPIEEHYRGSRRSLFATLLGMTLCATPLSAQKPDDPHAVQPERPTVATHAGTVAPGWLEIESGVERDRFAPDFASTSTPTVFKIGLASHVQLGLFATTVHSKAGSSVGDFAVGPKIRVLEDSPVLGDFAFLPSVKFPVGSINLGSGTGTTDASLLLISSHHFGDISMDLNVGVTRRSGDGTQVPTTSSLWTASFGGPLSGAFGWTLECFGFPGTSAPSGQPPVAALLGGPTVLARSWLAFDAGVIVPVHGPQPHALYVGAVYNVGQLWK